MHGEADRRGFLATHVAFRDESGAPVLKLVDTEKSVRCMIERRCQTCGFDLAPDDNIVFVGFRGDTAFKEPPIHLECAVYSLGMCPALVTRERSENLLVVVCRDYEYLHMRDDAPPLCRPLAIADDRGVEIPPVECDIDDLHRLLRAGLEPEC
jgi:hypothetical protein